MIAELGHPQPQTPIHIDNTTTVGIVNNTIKRQRYRVMEMRYFWLLDQETNKYFKFYYHPGQENLVDYPYKAHTGTIHTHVCPYYLHMDSSPNLLTRATKSSARRGCTEIREDHYYKGIPLPRIPNNRAPERDPSLPRTAWEAPLPSPDRHSTALNGPVTLSPQDSCHIYLTHNYLSSMSAST